MKIIDKIKIIESLIKEKQSTDLKSLSENQRLLVSQQLFVLNETQTSLMHSIGLKTKEEKEYEEEYYGR